MHFNRRLSRRLQARPPAKTRIDFAQLSEDWTSLEVSQGKQDENKAYINWWTCKLCVTNGRTNRDSADYWRNLVDQTQGRRHQVLFGGTDSWAVGTQTHLPLKFSFSTDFGHFISKMLENAKFANVSIKRCWNVIISGGTSPLIFRLRGTRPPRPPAFDAHDQTRFCQDVPIPSSYVF